MLASEWRAAGLLCWSELHELDTGLVGVEEIQLDFAVATDLRFGAVGAFAVILRKCRDSVAHV